MADQVTPRILTGPGGERLVRTGENRPPMSNEWFIGCDGPIRDDLGFKLTSFPILRLATPEEVEAAEWQGRTEQILELNRNLAVAEETQPKPTITCEDVKCHVCYPAAPSPAGEERGAQAEAIRQLVYNFWNKTRKIFGTAGMQELLRKDIAKLLAASPHARDGVPRPVCPKCGSDDLGFWPYVGQIACNKCTAVLGKSYRPYPGLGMFPLRDFRQFFPAPSAEEMAGKVAEAVIAHLKASYLKPQLHDLLLGAKQDLKSLVLSVLKDGGQ